MTDETWSTAAHDVVPPTEFGLALREAPTYLHALLRSDDSEFSPPYADVRANIAAVIAANQTRQRPGQAPSADVEDQRLRTWKKIFEDFGLLYVNDDRRLKSTGLGRVIRDLYADLDRRIAGANEHTATLALGVLGRQLLRNPVAAGDYPPDTDLHPYRAIWSALRALDNRVHWEELNRVLLRVLKDADVPTAIAKIRQVRDEHSTDYPSDAALAALGEPAVDDGTQTRRRITPWLRAAGFGGTFIADDGDGFWSLVPEYESVIDEALVYTPDIPAGALDDAASYMEYIAAGAVVTSSNAQQSDRALLDEALRAVDRLGNRKIITLAGLPGTGKTRLARLVAAAVAENDPYRVEEIQFHDGTTYDKFVEGFIPRSDGSGFDLVSMTLRVINKRALDDPGGRKFVLLIEELTRADVHSVLGELLTYVEHRDRKFRLPLSQQETQIAPNLVIIATMNPRDRSALVLDHAILRRMHQIAVPPDVEVLKAILAASPLDQTAADKLIAWFERYSSILPFGHGEFADVHDEDDLRAAWSGTLIYFFRDASGEVKEEYRDAVAAFPWG